MRDTHRPRVQCLRTMRFGPLLHTSLPPVVSAFPATHDRCALARLP